MVQPEYSLIEGKVDDSPENAMQQMWHPIPLEYAEHQQMEHAMHQQHPEEFMHQDEMDEYNYNQNIDHNTPHMLSPIYKDDQPYQQLHLSPEFVQNVPQPLVHLSPQQQQQQMIEIQAVQQQQQQQHHQPPPLPPQQMVVLNQQPPFNEIITANDYELPNSHDEAHVDAPLATLSIQHETDYHTSIDSFNNNIEEKNLPLIENSHPKILPSEGVKVPVVTTINNNSLKGSNSISSSSNNNNNIIIINNSNSNNNSSVVSGIPAGGSDNKSVDSTTVVVPKPIQSNAVQVQPVAAVASPSTAISTAELNKLVTSVNDKLIIKSDRAPSKQSSSGPWNKKNTASVSVSAVPISYPPPPFQPSNTRNADTSTPTNHHHKPTVPKSDHTLTKETSKEMDAPPPPVEHTKKSISVSTSNSQQSSIESRSVKVEVIPRVDNNPSIAASSDNLHATTPKAASAKDESQAAPQNQTPTMAPSVNSEISTPATTPSAPSTWAGLFASTKAGYATRTHSDPVSRKPVAKVSPFETSLNNAPQNNFVLDGQLSYSAASSQGLPSPSSSVSLNTGAQKKVVSKAAVAPTKATTPSQHGDESLKMGGMRRMKDTFLCE